MHSSGPPKSLPGEFIKHDTQCRCVILKDSECYLSLHLNMHSPSEGLTLLIWKNTTIYEYKTISITTYITVQQSAALVLY